MSRTAWAGLCHDLPSIPSVVDNSDVDAGPAHGPRVPTPLAGTGARTTGLRHQAGWSVHHDRVRAETAFMGQ